MARYHYTRENENGVVLYLESEPAEDAMDEFDDEIAVGFSGNGYLRFWTRCRRAAEALPNGLKYAADEIIGYNVGFDLGFLSAVGVRPREDARITDTMNLFTWFMGRRYKLVDAADHIGYEWTGRAHGSLADALATLAVQRWLEQWLVAE